MRRFPTLDFANSDELTGRGLVTAIGNPFGVGRDGDARHCFGVGATAGGNHRLSVLHPDRCGDQSGKLGWGAG